MEDSQATPPAAPAALEFSATSTKLFTALAEFHKTCPVIKKETENKYFHANYADLGTILATVNPLLAAQGLSVMQFPLPDYSLCTQLSHTSGEWVRSTYQLKPPKSDPQGIGSAMTYQMRYAIRAVLSLAIDDDDDDGQAAQQQPKKGAPTTNADKLRKDVGVAVRVLGGTPKEAKAAAELMLAESKGKYKLDDGQPLLKIADITNIENEETLRSLFTLFTPAQGGQTQ